jgi:uncharacterized protein
MSKDYQDRLTIPLARIPEEGLEIDERLPVGWLASLSEFSDETGAHLEGPIRVGGRLTKEGENLRLWGRVSADLVTICTRCGDPIHYPLAGEFQVVMIKGRPAVTAGEKELSPEEIVEYYYEGVEVDLNPYFRDEVALQVPIQPLCRPNCAGLCPFCGTNLNLGPCGCAPAKSDPRLAVLRNLKIEN